MAPAGCPYLRRLQQLPWRPLEASQAYRRGNTAQAPALPPVQLWTDQQIKVLLALINGPRRRVTILRPRPAYLPHPCRRLPRVQGVVRLSNWALMRL